MCHINKLVVCYVSMHTLNDDGKHQHVVKLPLTLVHSNILNLIFFPFWDVIVSS